MVMVAHAETFTIYRYGDVECRVNYDESRVAPYKLEDPLTFLDGRKVKTAADWEARRTEILGLFAREMYGAEPPPPAALRNELIDEKVTCAGYAIRRRYRMTFTPDKSGPAVNWIVWIPRWAKKPAPVILFLNYLGNQSLVSDPDIPVMSAWSPNEDHVKNHRVEESSRGALLDSNADSKFPLGMILARGYAAMSACYCEVSPDPSFDEPDPRFSPKTFAYTGVFSLWGPRDASKQDNPTALGAWAWALSRGLDLAESISEIDAKKSVVTGCSRLGKSALLAAARDVRFAVCVPNQCGGGGVCLAKRDFGESVKTEMNEFPHWYCRAYGKYAENPAKLLTFDQHLLVATIAPRALLVEGFDTSPWMDTKGEYLACKAAAPVWALLGKGTMPDVPYPANYDESAIGESFGYVRRSENHGIADCDWMWLLDFADRALGKDAKIIRCAAARENHQP